MKTKNLLEKACEDYCSENDFNGARGQGLANAKYSQMRQQKLEDEADFHYATDFLKDTNRDYLPKKHLEQVYQKAELLIKYNPKFKTLNGKKGKKLNTLWCAQNGNIYQRARIGSTFDSEYEKAVKTLERLNKK